LSDGASQSSRFALNAVGDSSAHVGAGFAR
jgi:hypothetical protein